MVNWDKFKFWKKRSTEIDAESKPKQKIVVKKKIVFEEFKTGDGGTIRNARTIKDEHEEKEPEKEPVNEPLVQKAKRKTKSKKKTKPRVRKAKKRNRT